MKVIVGAVYRHKKRGTTYEVLSTEAKVQASKPITEGDRVVIYEDHDGSMWVRPYSEFSDGRFEPFDHEAPTIEEVRGILGRQVEGQSDG